MARIQVLWLPSLDGETPPFAFVIDQIGAGPAQAMMGDPLAVAAVDDFATGCGARAVLRSTDTLEVV